MSSFLESKFEETFTEEQKVVRAPGVQDTHIHCVFLILDPVRLDSNIAASKQQANKYSTATPRVVGGLDEDLDLQVLRTLQGKTTIIPVISKADTITTAHMTFLKRTVWASLKQAKLDPLEALTVVEDSEEDDDEFDERDEDRYNDAADGRGSSRRNRDTLDSIDDLANRDGDGSAPASQHRRTASALSSRQENSDEIPYVPMSILSPDIYELDLQPPGRRFPWGFADPYNVEHCDFVRLKDSVFNEWRAELREVSRERWYEGWRTSRLKRHGPQQVRSLGGPGGVSQAAASSAGRPVTIGSSTASSGVRSANGRPQGIYGSPPPPGSAIGQAISGPSPPRVQGNGVPQGLPQQAQQPRMQSMGPAPTYKGGNNYR